MYWLLLCTRTSLKCCICINNPNIVYIKLSNLPNYSMTYYYPHFTDEEAEAQRG